VAIDVAIRDPSESAVARAQALVAAVRDDPAARLALAMQTYRGPTGHAPRHRPFRRAAMSFMRWEVERGVLAAVDADPPGSPWWRAMNERLVRDGCEAVARTAGLGGEISSPTIALWSRFIADPQPRHWYRAHNASIVSAYVEHRDLAERERLPERFFLNVVLLRVLFAHALVAAPRLAAGRLAPLGRLLGDPRAGTAGAFLSLGRVLPDRYPLSEDVATYLLDEQRLGRVLDYAVITPRLDDLYAWSASELGIPELATFVRDGVPAYAWPESQRHLWDVPHLSLAAHVLRALTAARGPRPGTRPT
jgi:hypothetical protein